MKAFISQKAALAFVGLAVVLPPVANATPIHVQTTTTNGVVPGTGINYTIASTGDGGPVNFRPLTGSSDSGTWAWNNGFPEYLSFGSAQTLTVTFDAPLSIDHLVFGIDSISNTSAQLTLVGGTASTADFALADGISSFSGVSGVASYNPANGLFTASGADRTLMVGSLSTNTVTGFTLAAGASNGGSDGFGVFAGFTVPEPDTFALFGVGLWLLRSQARRMRLA